MNRKNGEEKVKLSRIARIDEEIRSGKYPNSEELAAKLEVSSRTILRDIEFLKYSYDAPIEYDFAKRGFYYTRDNFFIRSVMLTKEELETLTVFDELSKRSIRDDDDFSIRFRKIIDKLLMVLPEGINNSLPFSPIPENTHDFIFNPNIQIDLEINTILIEAIKNKETIEIEYWASSNRKFEKFRIDPLYLFFKRHHYYILAWKKKNRETAGIYSVNRIKYAKNTGLYFEVPENFKASEFLNKEVKFAPRDDKLFIFELSFPKEIAEEAIEKTYYHNQMIKLCEDGTVFVSFRSTQLHGVFHWVLSQGHKVKVINPPELVKMIKREAQKVVQYYL